MTLQSAQSAGLQMPLTALAGRAFDLPCHPTSGASFAFAPIIAQTVKPDTSARCELRASILAALKARRAQMIERAREARQHRRHKARLTYEVEIAALTNSLMFLEAGQ